MVLLQRPLLLMAIALPLSLNFSDFACGQDTHTLKLKIDDATARLGAAQRTLSVADRTRFNESLAKLRRELEEFEEIDAELDSQQAIVEVLRCTAQKMAGKFNILRQKNQIDFGEWWGNHEEYDRLSTDHNREAAEYNNSVPPSLPEAYEEYRRKGELGNEEAQRNNKRGEALQGQWGVLQERKIEEEQCKLEVQEAVDELQDLKSQEKELAGRLSEEIQKAITKVDELIASIPAALPPGKSASTKNSPIPQEYQRGGGDPIIDPSVADNEEPGGIFTSQQPVIGAMGAVKGDAWVLDAMGQKHRLQTGDAAYHNAVYKTGADSQFQIILKDDTCFTAGPNSVIKMDDYVYNPNTDPGSITAHIDSGIFRFVTGKLARKKPKKFKVKVPVGTIGVRGTDYVVEVAESGETKVGVLSGAVVFQPNGSSEETWVRPGQQIRVSPDQTITRCKSSDAAQRAATLLPMPHTSLFDDPTLRLVFQTITLLGSLLLVSHTIAVLGSLLLRYIVGRTLGRRAESQRLNRQS
jgi:hypothetical protein